ncbi:MAG: SPOR domain-containing protein, partial [Sphingobacteriaceae bacterium]
HISESSAQYFVERFTENVKKGLDKNRSATIAPLGTLHNSENGYSFQSESISSSDFFGLKPVKEPELIKQAPLANAVPAKSERKEIIAEETTSSSSNSKGIWITLFVILTVAAIGAIVYFSYPQYFKNLKFSTEKKPNNKAAKPVAVPVIKDSVSFADSLVSELEKQGMNAEVEKAPDSITISSNTTTPDSLKVAPKPAKVYEIIVASFGLKREAETSVKALRRKGIDAKVVEDTKKPKFKVSIGTFTVKTTADKERKRIQQELTKDAWILTITNKEN